MPIQNSDAVLFSNERIRPVADKLSGAYYACKRLVNDWHATGINARFAPGGGKVADGSDTDGRITITSDDVLLVVTRAQEFIADYEAGSNAKLNTVLKPAVNRGA